MDNAKVLLRAHCLPPMLAGSRGRLFLFLNRELYRAFFGVPVNALLVATAIGGSLFRVWIRGKPSLGGYAPLQLLLWPFLMAIEEFLHILVFWQKRLPDVEIDLVTVHRISRKGSRLICYGGAVRFRGPLEQVDRIQISVPGPAMGLFAALLLWSIVSLASGSLYAAGAHLTALPTLLYLLSGLWPFEIPFPTDLSNILRAKREGELSWRQVLKVGLGGLGLVWRAVRGVDVGE